jgi:hypothetical protein
MSPEQRQIKELQEKVAILEQQLRQFLNLSELDPQIIRTISSASIGASGKTAASATQAVNEGGAGTYDVMFPPTGFIRIGDFDVPYI